VAGRLPGRRLDRDRGGAAMSNRVEADGGGEAGVLRDAEVIERQLGAIRRLARSTLRADIALGRLTRPQLLALDAIVRHGGLGLKALARHLALAHSTVSGIVDRL